MDPFPFPFPLQLTPPYSFTSPRRAMYNGHIFIFLLFWSEVQINWWDTDLVQDGSPSQLFLFRSHFSTERTETDGNPWFFSKGIYYTTWGNYVCNSNQSKEKERYKYSRLVGNCLVFVSWATARNAPPWPGQQRRDSVKSGRRKNYLVPTTSLVETRILPILTKIKLIRQSLILPVKCKTLSSRLPATL